MIFLTGLSGAGKTTLAYGLARRLRRPVTTLDGDEIRQTLSSGLGFSRVDRATNVRRVGWVAAEIARHGGISICALIAPSASVRAEVRAMAAETGADFVLVYVATPLEICESRDPKGLYSGARRGVVSNFTGVSDTYEVPQDAEIVLSTDSSEREVLLELSAKLVELGYLSHSDFLD